MKSARRLLMAMLSGTSISLLAIPAAGAAAAHPSLLRARAGIVDINVDLPYEDATGAGTGMVLGTNGEIVTNNHVVRDATAISVTDIADGTTYPATVVGYDETADIAVLQLTGATGLRRIPVGDSHILRVGSPVTALGNAGGVGGTPSSATGSITALHKSIIAADELGSSEALKGLLETNAVIQAGDSGGPLVLDTGKVVGMDTAGSQSGPKLSSAAPTTQGYAVPIDEVLRIARNIEAGHATAEIHIGNTPFLGVEVEQINGRVVVRGVFAESPAASAGLVPGDVISMFDGTAVTNSTTLTNLILEEPAGAAVPLGWTTRTGLAESATVTLASGPAQ